MKEDKKEDLKLIDKLKAELQKLTENREKLKEQFHQIGGAISATEDIIKIMEEDA